MRLKYLANSVNDIMPATAVSDRTPTGFLKPSQATINDTLFFISLMQQLANKSVSLKIMRYNDGIIALYHQVPSKYLEIGFYGDGTAYMWWATDSDEEGRKDRVVIDNNILKLIPHFFWD